MDQNAEQVVNLLIQKKWHISFAESCTGGLAAAALVDVPNASLVLDVSFVTYASEAKVRVLGVRQETIDRFTVVSGPSGGTAETPVGTVCFGFFVKGREWQVTKHFGSIGRQAVRQASVAFVFETLREMLER